MWPGQSYASVISIAIVEPKMYNSSANGISSERVFERVRPGCASGSKWLAQQAFVQIHAIFKIRVRFPILDAAKPLPHTTGAVICYVPTPTELSWTEILVRT